MPEENELQLVDWHSDEWWMHVYEDVLSTEEERMWEEHLSSCSNCQVEWEAMHRLDDLMQYSPVVPELSPAFTANTLQQITRKLRWRRILSIIAGSIILIAVALPIFMAFDSAFQTVEQSLRVIFSARYVLFSSFVQIALGLIEGWRMLLPFFIGLTIFVFMLLMPNSALVTFAVVWYSRRQRRQYQAI